MHSTLFLQPPELDIYQRRRSTWASWGNTDDSYDSIPLLLALSMCAGWILISAAVFMIWENEWSYFTAVYFVVISLLTIGLGANGYSYSSTQALAGDINPSRPRIFLMNFWLLVIGLAMVSMLINVIQMKIEVWLLRMMKMMQVFDVNNIALLTRQHAGRV